jgi:uncharacterized membrane protein
MQRFIASIILSFGLLSGLAQVEPITLQHDNQTFEQDGIRLQFINGDFAEKNKNYKIVNFDNSGQTLFNDQYKGVIIDFGHTTLPKGFVDKLYVTVNGRKFELPQLSPFAVEGYEMGEFSIKVAAFDKAGNPLPFQHASGGKLKLNIVHTTPVFESDAVVLGILILILALIFYTSHLPSFKKFYTLLPALLLCYFIPGILNSLGIISGEASGLYKVASRYLLPASLILLCLGMDLKGVLRLGPKALIVFLAGTFGVIIGGPIALLITAAISPDLLGANPSEVWKGLSTIAGSWIGGGANQTAMKEIYGPSEALFSKMIVVDVMVANVWMAVLLFGAGMSDKIDTWFKADNSAITDLKNRLEKIALDISRVPSSTDLMVIAAIGFGGTAISHFGADVVTPYFDSMKDWLAKYGLNSLASGFFWLVVFATTLGVALSFTKLKKYEGAGASKMGSLLLYILVATIGMKMDIGEIFKTPGLFVVGFIWMFFHAIFILLIARLIKAPFFFVAVGSQANVGGAASAPIVASAFSPSLATVGVLLAVFGYALGTYGAWLCAYIMEMVSP